jgi:RHS repeat-associated protein
MHSSLLTARPRAALSTLSSRVFSFLRDCAASWVHGASMTQRNTCNEELLPSTRKKFLRSTRFSFSVLLLLAILLPNIAPACSNFDIFLAPPPTHHVLQADCPTSEAARLACYDFSTSHGYPPENFCSLGGYLGFGVWAAGSLRDPPNGPTFYLGQFIFPERNQSKPDKNAGPRCPLETSFADPINAATGNKYETEVLYTGSGAFPLSLALTYNSAPIPLRTASVAFGRNRSDTYSANVDVRNSDSHSIAYVSRPDGNVMRFTLTDGEWLADMDNPAELSAQMSGAVLQGWQLELEGGGIELFDASGRLSELRNSQGLNQRLSYSNGRLSAVTDIAGRSLNFVYNSSGRVEEVRLPDGQNLILSYTAATDLFRVQHPGGDYVEYSYDEPAHITGSAYPGSLTGVIDENHLRYSTTKYVNRFAVSTELAGGVDRSSSTFEIAQNAVHSSRSTITMPIGATRVVEFAIHHGVALPTSSTLSCPGCTTQEKNFTYDANGKPDVFTLGGVVTDHDYNPRGLEIRRIDARGKDTQPANLYSNERKTETEWHAGFRVPTERRIYRCSAPSRTSAQPCSGAGGSNLWQIESLSRYAYNARGQVTARCDIDPAIPAAMAYSCGAQAQAPTGVRQVLSSYCELSDPDIGSASCPFEGYVRSIDGPRNDVADISTRTYYAADHASCAAAPTTCPYRKGDLWKLTNALGQVTEFLSYDGAGRVLRQKDANDVITDLSYHARGWLVSRTVRANADGTPNPALDASTRLEYEPYGDIKRVIQPDDSGLEYCRDQAHRITAVAQTNAAQGSVCSNGAPVAGAEAIVYTLDAAGNRTREEVRDTTGATKRLLARQYTTLSQLRSLVHSGFANAPDLDDPAVLKTSYSYDANGNQDLSTDELGRVSDNDYDPLNRLIQAIQDKDTANASGEIAAKTQYEYDARNNLRRVIDPNQLVTEYTYDGLNNQTRLDSPDTGATIYTYDTAGNRASQTDARGVVSSYAYDALNRLQGISYPSDPTKDTGFVYDSVQADCTSDETFSIGRLTRVTDASGETRMCYDAKGNLTRKVQITKGQTLSVRYQYDKANRIIGTEYPSGASVIMTRDSLGRVQTASLSYQGSTISLIDSVAYLPFGPMASINFANGQTLAKQWDQDYWPDAVSSPAFNYDFSTNAVGTITAIASSSDPARSYSYDRLDRLQEVRDANQALIEAYTYDASGNRTSRTQGNTTEPYLYTNQPAAPVLPGSPGYSDYTHRLNVAAKSDDKASSPGIPWRSYDEAGNTLSITNGPGSTEFAFDSRNRMSEHRNIVSFYPKDPSTEYDYNGRGERVWKRINSGSASGTVEEYAYVYDQSGQRLGAYQFTGANSWAVVDEVIWLESTPVAVAHFNGGQLSVQAIMSDHLNSPRALTTLYGGNQTLGTTVWKWSLTAQTASGNNAFGNELANPDPDANGTAINFDLRFPGQQFDAETGLHYNYFRDYEPGTGRYVESDPIGLVGGISTFSYVQSNPLSRTDSRGLCCDEPTMCYVQCASLYITAVAACVVIHKACGKSKVVNSFWVFWTPSRDWVFTAPIIFCDEFFEKVERNSGPPMA